MCCEKGRLTRYRPPATAPFVLAGIEYACSVYCFVTRITHCCAKGCLHDQGVLLEYGSLG